MIPDGNPNKGEAVFFKRLFFGPSGFDLEPIAPTLSIPCFFACSFVCFLTLILAGSLFLQSPLDFYGVFNTWATYLMAFSTVSVLFFLGVFFFEFFDALCFSKKQLLSPLSLLKASVQYLGSRVFALQIVILPILLTSFTISKMTLPYLFGFSWDAYFADLDVFFLGDDAWQLLHVLFAHNINGALEFWYIGIWSVIMFFFPLIIFLPSVSLPAFKKNRFVLSYCLLWILAGIFLAALFGSAGPVFAHLFDDTLKDRFDGLRFSLIKNLPLETTVLKTQDYLQEAFLKKIIVKGGGISAMPSMHVILSFLYVVLFYQTSFFWVSLLCLLLTIVGSVYFGYHYAIEAPVCFLIVLGVWFFSGFVLKCLNCPAELGKTMKKVMG